MAPTCTELMRLLWRSVLAPAARVCVRTTCVTSKSSYRRNLPRRQGRRRSCVRHHDSDRSELRVRTELREDDGREGRRCEGRQLRLPRYLPSAVILGNSNTPTVVGYAMPLLHWVTVDTQKRLGTRNGGAVGAGDSHRRAGHADRQDYGVQGDGALLCQRRERRTMSSTITYNHQAFVRKAALLFSYPCL